MEDKYMTLAKASERSGVPKRTLQYHALKGYLKTMRLDNGIFLTTDEWLNEWVNTPEFRAKGPKKK